MRILQAYDHAAVRDDVVAKGWGIADLWRATNAIRAKATPPKPALSYDAVARFFRGDSHNNATAVDVAVALGKTESDYRMPAAPARKARGRRQLAGTR